MATNPKDLPYSNLLRGKSVAIVGGHDDVHWSEVHSKDLVVRVNGHWGRQGGRMDIVYDSCAMDVDHGFYLDPHVYVNLQFAQLNIMHKFWGHTAGEFNHISRFLSDSGIPWDFYVHAPLRLYETMEQLRVVPPRHTWAKEFAEEYQIFPFTGVLAIRHLLLQPIKSLYVDGMDLFMDRKDEESPNYRRAGSHYLPPQVKYLRDIENDERITFSNNLVYSLEDFERL